MTPQSKWNIFARELELVLDHHGLRIGQLDNRYDDEGLLVHPAKVSRLKKSLEETGISCTLNPKELDRMAKLFQFKDEETARLRVAVMATAIEKALMMRLKDAETALVAADDVFRILLSALVDHPQLSLAKGDVWLSGPSSEADDDFGYALDLIDQGTLALHAYAETASTQNQRMYASEAQSAYKQAQDYLQHSKLPKHSDAEWQAWYAEAVEQEDFAAKLLKELGARY